MFRVSERLARKQKHTLVDLNQQTSWREEESGASTFPLCTAHACLHAAIVVGAVGRRLTRRI